MACSTHDFSIFAALAVLSTTHSFLCCVTVYGKECILSFKKNRGIKY